MSTKTTAVASTVTTPKAPRVVSPGIAKLREEHKANVAKFKAEAASAGTLKRIMEDLLPKLTDEDAGKLWSDLGALARVTSAK